MKKTVLYKTIDGHNIVVGFDYPSINPVETKEIVDEAILETPEHQALEAKKAEYSKAVKDMHAAKKKKDESAYNAAMAAMSVRQDELKPLARDHADKIMSLRISEAVYFKPRQGEVIIDAAEADALLQAIKNSPKGVCINRDGSEIEDNRGAIFFRKSGGKWMRSQIVKLGDAIPGDAVLEADVTATQRDEIETDRVASLPEAEKAAEKAEAMEKAIADATVMRSRLEIKSDSDALAKSQEFYQTEVALIEGLYG